MKFNKIILSGFILIALGGVIFFNDFLNPIIRPFTHLFLMGSSKGKDIIFFGLFGLFLILSQVIKKDIDSKKYLKASIVIGIITLVFGIILEIIFRVNMGIGLNNIFCSVSNTMTSTSIIHTHLIKSILGKVITQIIGSSVESGINTGIGLYDYIPNISFIAIFLILILTITLILSLQKNLWSTQIILSFFSSCLLIGITDGGLFATPSLLGICGLILLYRNGYYVNLIVGTLLKDEKLLEENKKTKPYYYNYPKKKYLLHRGFIGLIVIFIILLRLSIGFAGSEVDYYTVEISNISSDVNFKDIPITHINNNIYHVDSSYNEMELVNALKNPLNNSCDYYTVSWNTYSYF